MSEETPHIVGKKEFESMGTDENYGLQHMAGEQFNDTSEDQITSAEAWNIMQGKIGELQRAKEELLAALQFVYDMAEEEYNYQTGNVGAECALRHIVRKSSEAIAKHK